MAERLDHFKKPLESGLKVANMGQKTLRLEAGGERSETKFNYSSNEDAKLLTDRFERIGESLRTLLELRRAARHDRLGVNAAVLKIQSLWDNRSGWWRRRNFCHCSIRWPRTKLTSTWRASGRRRLRMRFGRRPLEVDRCSPGLKIKSA